MSEDEQFFKCLNMAREHPAYFVPLIEQQIKSFVSDKELPLAPQIIYETNEGKDTWIQARNFLLTQKPLPPLKINYGLAKSAEEHKNDLCQNGIFGHKGTDGSTFSQRILRHCKKGPGAMAEIIGADFDIPGRNTYEMTILALIIDDGVKDRGHRKTIFSPVYKYVGYSSGKQDQKIITVFNLTENFLNPLFSNENNSFCLPTDSKNNFSQSLGHWENPLSDATNKPRLSRVSDVGKGFGFNTEPIPSMKKNKKIIEKRENSRTYFQQGSKVIVTTTQLIYNDGSVEENNEKRTLYAEQ